MGRREQQISYQEVNIRDLIIQDCDLLSAT
jgi:hypothetical protein